MNKDELKQIIKPLIKQCIREVLMEDGLRNILSEAQSLSPHAQKQTLAPKPQKPALTENRKKLLDEIGKSGYMNGKFDPFANTAPLTEAQANNKGPSTGPLKDIDPSDPGVDISNLMGGSNKKIWKALVGGKAK
jgi:hypothetical protein